MADLRARATLDPSAFKAGLNQLSSGAQSLQQQLTGVGRQIAGAFTIGALVKTGKDFMDLASQINDLSINTGLSTTQVQAFGMAIRDAGGQESDLLMVMKTVRDMQSQVISGNKTAIESFAKLGLSQEQVIRSSPADLLETVSRAFVQAGSDGQAYGAALDILGGRVAPKLIEAFQRLGTDGFAALSEQAKSAGQVIDDELIKRMDELSDKMGRWDRMQKVFWGNLADRWATGVSQFYAFLGAASGAEGGIKDRITAGLDAMSDVEREGMGKPKADTSKAEEARRVADAAAAREKAQKEQWAKEDERYEKEKARIMAQIERENAARAKAAADDYERRKKVNDDKDRIETDRIRAIADAKRNTTAGLPEAADQLARIGGYSRDAMTPQTRIAEQQLAVLREIKEINRRASERAADVGGYV